MLNPGQEVYHVDTLRTGVVLKQTIITKNGLVVAALQKVADAGHITKVRWDDTREIEQVNTSDLEIMTLKLVELSAY